MSNEDWKNWSEPTETSVVLWTHPVDGRQTVCCIDSDEEGNVWGSRDYSDTWAGLLGRIADDGDGTPPLIIDPWAKPAPEPEPERVIVWKTGDPIDKLKPYVGKKSVEVRAERNGAVMTGPLTASAGLVLHAGGMLLYAPDWDITVTVTVTAPEPSAPWWLIDHIETGHIVSWTTLERKQRFINWNDKLDDWRNHWDKSADPTTWRVTDIHAVGGPKMVAGR